MSRSILLDARSEAAEAKFQEFDFEGYQIERREGFEYVVMSRETQPVTYSAKAYGEEGERVVFKVVFEPDRSEVIESYALDLNSGCMIG